MLQGTPLLTDIRKYALGMTDMMLSLSNSYSDFYLAIGNDLLVTLPSAVTDVFDALMGIVDAIADIASNPLGVFNSLTNAVTK